MFVTQAHSFTQQARLAITLAWVAGYTNILTVITCGTVTSHVSGTASNLGWYVSEGSWRLAAFAFFLLVSFFLGAAASGFLTELGRRRGWDSIYALPIAVETMLLATLAIGLELHDHGERQSGAPLYWLTGVASLAMGLQNATITRISSGVVRTSHITGVLTDLGLESTQFLLWARPRLRRTVGDVLPRDLSDLNHLPGHHHSDRRDRALGPRRRNDGPRSAGRDRGVPCQKRGESARQGSPNAESPGVG